MTYGDRVEIIDEAEARFCGMRGIFETSSKDLKMGIRLDDGRLVWLRPMQVELVVDGKVLSW